MLRHALLPLGEQVENFALGDEQPVEDRLKLVVAPGADRTVGAENALWLFRVPRGLRGQDDQRVRRVPRVGLEQPVEWL